MAEDGERPIIKKVKKVQAAGAHGGAWKVAYADFVTAMMAFFMLLWLLNVAPPETLSGLANYFSPTSATTMGESGNNKPLHAGMMATPGNNPNLVTAIQQPGPPAAGAEEKTDGQEAEEEGKTPGQEQRLEDFLEQQRQQEDLEFDVIKESLQTAIQKSPTLAEHDDQVVIEVTEDGMKIQLIDKDKRSMFRSGTDDLYNFAQAMLREVGAAIQNVPNRVTLEGHTDNSSSESRPGYSNWELSADRANSARRVLGGSGVSGDRFYQIVGRAATDPLYPDRPNRADNRRITITLMREEPVVPYNLGN